MVSIMAAPYVSRFLGAQQLTMRASPVVRAMSHLTGAMVTEMLEL